jgi:beta-lactamase regulating signal transducer with metallopeptidase domain
MCAGGALRLFHPALHCPIVVGVLRGSVVISEKSLLQDESARRMIVLHWLARIKRRDALFRPLLVVAKAQHWPNPLLLTPSALEWTVRLGVRIFLFELM